jgi:hypothetical protein
VLCPSDVVRPFVGNTNHNGTVGAHVAAAYTIHNPLLHYCTETMAIHSSPILGLAGSLGRKTSLRMARVRRAKSKAVAT